MGEIAPGRDPAAGSSSRHGDGVARHLFRVLVLTTAAVLTASAAILGLLAMSASVDGTPAHLAMDAAVQVFADAAMPHLGSIVAALLMPFPLAGVVAVAVLCAVAAWARPHSHRTAAESRHGS